MERLVRFELLGQEYSFYSGAPEHEVEEVLDLVRGLVGENASGAQGAIPVSKLAILASLNMASRYVELSRNFDQYREDMEKRLSHLCEEIAQTASVEKENGGG
ncbi:MAG: cell division protein ZapA [Desulfobulbaceae bacterium]|uniref:Cell division protein ZapA n=1 Tax=Candidatus Desulfatifera sulfidica TaxID=2841691 RepID=A0A8J6TCP9_9BACT|nr:cell division protein ZapA [Candidatus Desulfatifera sulfidica]